jgi:putative tricarboxylic transport membrane protein
MTIDRVGGVVLALLALFTIEETYRLKLPLGNLQNPGPAYMPTLLALLLLGFAILIVVFGARTPALGGVGWREWRHAVAILAVCAFMALGLERLGYRLTIFVALAFLLGVVERQRLVTTAVFSVAFSAASFYLFAVLLRVPLPRGPWGF